MASGYVQRSTLFLLSVILCDKKRKEPTYILCSKKTGTTSVLNNISYFESKRSNYKWHGRPCWRGGVISCKNSACSVVFMLGRLISFMRPDSVDGSTDRGTVHGLHNRQHDDSTLRQTDNQKLWGILRVLTRMMDR